MPRQKRDSEYESQNSSNRYNKDSLDHYNEDLSKRAVGSIFSNIERGVSKEDDIPKEIVVNTDFEVKNNSVRKELVGQFFNDEAEAADAKRRPKQVREAKRPATQSGRPQSNSNSALTRDDDTISAKYVTRGNHQPITTPAMAARRKNVTMMESQRMPVITDAEINEYKKNNTEKTFAYVNGASKKTMPLDYDNYMNSKEVTSEQKEIIELLKNEVTQREQVLEDTLHRMNEKNKHYQDIIESTNRRLNHKETPIDTNNVQNFDGFDNFADFENFDDFEDNNDFDNFRTESEPVKDKFVTSKNDFDTDEDFNVDDDIFFGDILIDDSEINFTEEDLDKDFEETIATNAKSKQSKPFIPTKNLQETQSRIHTKTLLMQDNSSDFYDLETDTYVEQKSKYSTGEVKKINDTIATEISIDELDEFVFDNYDTADMEYLRKTIKEKTKAQKMQSIDKKIHEFERTHRDFGGKQNVPPKTTPKQRPVQQEQPQQEQYEYRKTRQKVDKQTTYDTAPHRNASYDTASRRAANQDTLPDYDTSSFKRDYDTSSLKNIYDTDSHDTKYDTGSYNTGRVSSATGRVASTRTSRIATVDLENDIEDYSTKFNISLIINIILAVSIAIVATLMFMKNNSINSITEELDATKAELLNQSNTITELQVELDYYKNLYLSTEEGKLSLEKEANGETTDGEEGEESASNSTERTYTVQAGDTLSSISRDFYGSSSEYQKIIDANSLTSDSLTLGQVLIIPN